MWKIIIAIVFTILYGVSPYDLLPDFVLGWGWLDDALIIWILWQLLKRFRNTRASYQHGPDSSHSGGAETGQNDGRQTGSQAGSQHHEFKDDPYTVLGIQPGATEKEIRQAYRQLAAQYHPDKVMHLGEEFRALAEKRFKEIQEAYQELVPPGK